MKFIYIAACLVSAISALPAADPAPASGSAPAPAAPAAAPAAGSGDASNSPNANAPAPSAPNASGTCSGSGTSPSSPANAPAAGGSSNAPVTGGNATNSTTNAANPNVAGGDAALELFLKLAKENCQTIKDMSADKVAALGFAKAQELVDEAKASGCDSNKFKDLVKEAKKANKRSSA